MSNRSMDLRFLALVAVLLAACEADNHPPGRGTNDTYVMVARDPNGGVAAIATAMSVNPDAAGSGQKWHSDSTRQGRGDTRFVAYEPTPVKPATWPAGLFFVPNVEITTHTRPGALPGFHLVGKTHAQADSLATVVVDMLRADGWAEVAPHGGPPHAQVRTFTKGTHTYDMYQLDTVVQLTGAGSEGA